jgi:hypothetical protein
VEAEAFAATEVFAVTGCIGEVIIAPTVGIAVLVSTEHPRFMVVPLITGHAVSTALRAT